MRLNSTVHCPGCKAQVNPFVIEEEIKISDDGNSVDVTISADSELECPTCGEKFPLNKDELVKNIAREINSASS